VLQVCEFGCRAAGNLYGTSQHGGVYRDGTVYKLVDTNGVWNYTSHTTSNLNGGAPGTLYGAVVLEASGKIYGTTDAGPYNDSGLGSAVRTNALEEGRTEAADKYVLNLVIGATANCLSERLVRP
jgi:hypothetical protein